MNIEAKAIKL